MLLTILIFKKIIFSLCSDTIRDFFSLIFPANVCLINFYINSELPKRFIEMTSFWYLCETVILLEDLTQGLHYLIMTADYFVPKERSRKEISLHSMSRLVSRIRDEFRRERVLLYFFH